MNTRPLALLTLLITPALAGPLDPPTGPIAPTQKPLAEVEPRIAVNQTNTPGDGTGVIRITQPGSYYLTGDIFGEAGKHGIEITASEVTLDLNGFQVVGTSGALDGIRASNFSLVNITIRNGTIRDWGGHGINFGLFSGPAAIISCTIEGVRAFGNLSTGIFTGPRTVVSDCTSEFNGFNGFGLGDGSTISNSSANFNSLNGFAIGNNVNVSHCTATRNGDAGFLSGNGCVIGNSIASENLNGFSVASACSISDSVARANTQQGIVTGTYARIDRCSVVANRTNGINAGSASVVANCLVTANHQNGIVVPNACTVRDNTIEINGLVLDGAGILATGGSNRIEGNNSLSADRGIHVTAPRNIIIRNTCAGNTVNWNIVAGNVFGPIIDRTAPGSGAVLGNSAPDAMGSAHPNANFTY